jgi:hypothetical protein
MTKAKKQYDLVLSGKSLRAAMRLQSKKAKKGVLTSPLGKMRSRQDRKTMAKILKVDFQPRYNGPVIEKAWKLVPRMHGNKPSGYTKLVLEAK